MWACQYRIKCLIRHRICSMNVPLDVFNWASIPFPDMT